MGICLKPVANPQGILVFAHLGLFVCVGAYRIQVYWGYVLNTLMKCFDEHVDAPRKQGVGGGVTVR